MDNVNAPKFKVQDKVVYDAEQIKNIIALSKDERLEPVITLAGYLGLRRGEIAGLKWQHIDFKNQTIDIVNTRTQIAGTPIEKDTKNTSSTRRLHLPTPVSETLLAVREKQESMKSTLGKAYNDNGYIIAWENGLPFRPNYLSEMFKKFLEKNNLPHIRLHDLRHSFASVANELGISIHDISKALGHSNISVTSSIYTHLFDQTQKSAIDAISNKLTD